MNKRNLKIFITLIFAFLIFVPKDNLAQNTSSPASVVPGSEELQYDKLQGNQYTYELYLVTGNQEIQIGTLTEKVRILKKVNIVERVQKLKRGNSEHVDSVRAALDSFAPLFHSSLNNNREILLQFNSSGVEGTYKPANSTPVDIHQTFGHRYFDSNWVDLVIRLLPLRSGYERTIKTFEVAPDGTPGFVPYQVKVLGQEEIQMENGENKKVWIVHQIKQNSLTKFFIEPSSMEVLQMKVLISDTRKMVMRRTQ